MTSCSGKDLLAWFLGVGQATMALPCRTILDGEIVIADQDGVLDLGALQDRPAESAELRASPPCTRRSDSVGSLYLYGDGRLGKVAWGARGCITM